MVAIDPIFSKKELKQFIKFKIDLYRGNPYAVPPLYVDELAALLKGKNPALDVYDHQVFLAKRDGVVVGRVVAIINHVANQKCGEDLVRFGYVDFIDDNEVVDALIATVEKWGAERGMTAIHGPLGFTDFDPEGMLIDGFDQIATLVDIYNYDYYPRQLERLGFRKDVDSVEYKIYLPEVAPVKYDKIAQIAQQKYGLKLLKYKSIRRLMKDGYANKMFDLLNLTYDDLYGFSKLDDNMINYYIGLYMPLMRVELLRLVVDENDQLVGLCIVLPSLAKALQKAKGRLFPFGFIPILRALKGKSEVCEFMLIGVHPQYRNKGTVAILFSDMIHQLQRLGTKYAESNPELEDNQNIRMMWNEFETEQHKRRRIYKRTFNVTE